MPYRIDVFQPRDDAFDRLVQLGALDVEPLDDGQLAAILPDTIAADAVTRALGAGRVRVSRAAGQDDGSVWVIRPRAVRVGGVLLAPPGAAAPAGALRLTESTAFGSGLHPTTALCLEAIEEELALGIPGALLDVGTGSGVLALAALMKGVPKALGLDTDATALDAAAEHARVNAMEGRLMLVRGGPEAIRGAWSLIVANVQAAPLIEIAPVLVRRVGHRGRLILSGIPQSVAPDVDHAFRRSGMRQVRTTLRAGWAAVVVEAAW
jgi:ribosomal protein L11 methyltransferase